MAKTQPFHFRFSSLQRTLQFKSPRLGSQQRLADQQRFTFWCAVQSELKEGSRLKRPLRMCAQPTNSEFCLPLHHQQRGFCLILLFLRPAQWRQLSPNTNERRRLNATSQSATYNPEK